MTSQLESFFVSEPFYWGTLSGEEASNVLSSRARGTFLVRWSLNRDHPVVTFVADEHGHVKHAMVVAAAAVPGQFTLEGDAQNFGDVKSFLAAHSASLVHPLRAPKRSTDADAPPSPTAASPRAKATTTATTTRAVAAAAAPATRMSFPDLASKLLFVAFMISLAYELWRDYVVGDRGLQQPTPLLRISDNRVTTLHENAPTYVLSFAMVFAVRLDALWLKQLGFVFALLSLVARAVYLFDVFCLRLATSPVPAFDVAEATLTTALLGAALLALTAQLKGVKLVVEPSVSDAKKRN